MTTKPFEGTVRCEWFQSPTRLTFTFYVRDRQEDDVSVVADAQSLTVNIRLNASGRDYQYTLHRLYAPLSTAAPVVSVRATKVEVSVAKAEELQWPALEAPDGNCGAASFAALPASSRELKYPNSLGRDWNSVRIEDEEAKPEGEQALNALFQQIYGNGTDDQRRAMMKSFIESNGTVLSTNWDDVGKREVKAEPPTGMEAKSYNS